MWWIIIIILLIVYIIKFWNASREQTDSVIKQGGMRIKYKTLIDHMLVQDPRARIFQETNTFISVGISGAGGLVAFLIQQTFKTVTIKWKLDSPVFGKHQLEWTFDEFLDQKKMIDKINNDLTAYQTNMMQKFI